MKKFSIECNNKKIGETDLEFTDEHMGMHFGQLGPVEGYYEFQKLFRDAYENQNWEDFNFAVISNKTNNKINFNFVWIEDNPDVPDEIEVTVNVKSNEEIANA